MDGGEREFHKDRPTFIDSVPKEMSARLLELRKKILEFTDEPLGPDVDPKAGNPRIPLLPAFRRYTGRTYSQITTEAWEAILEDENLDMVIVSPFYGLVLYDDPIRNYELKSVDKAPDGKTIKTFWKGQDLSEILEEFIFANKFERVMFVLSESYSTMIKREKLSERLEERGVACSYHQFKEFGRGSMIERGRFITRFATGMRDQV